MECINHPSTSAAGNCQMCGKALCASCMNRFSPPLCEPCLLSNNAKNKEIIAKEKDSKRGSNDSDEINIECDLKNKKVSFSAKGGKGIIACVSCFVTMAIAVVCIFKKR